jgi:asparagine synthase (glutamine-hydrolysing)
MCGIAGIVGTIGPSNREALRRMTDAISHRGPDSAGFWTSTADERGLGCLMGHRRLSIIDLSQAADQPMTDGAANGSHTIVFNGEIYNFKALRAALGSSGPPLQSTGDTAVMLRLLATEGPDAVRKLRGMFAFALWDHSARRLVLARDPLGIKPLYVCGNPDPNGEWSLLFSSEVRSILASKLLARPRLDRRALASVIWNGFVTGPVTIVEGIESLGPGELRIVDARGQTSRRTRYWQMPVKERVVHEAELHETLKESVALHLISDVPLGIFLSGGIDSSAVANLAQKACAGPVHTFTLAFEEQQFNEGEHARQIAKAIGTSHREIMLTEQQFAADVERAIDTLDQPTVDGLNSYYISRAVREAGLTVALVGTGGDELFGGYPSFRTIPAMLRWAQRTRLVPERAKIAAARIASRQFAGSRRADVPPQTRWAKLPDIVRAGDDLVGLYQLVYAMFLPEFQERLLVDPEGSCEIQSGVPPETTERLRTEIDGRSPMSAVSVLEQRVFLGERLLRDVDAASMAVSLETRLPLVDSVVVETVSGLADEERFAPAGRKAILRRAGLVGLDPGLFERPKSGFVLPFDRWIRRSLGAAMNDTMRDAALARAVGLNAETVTHVWSAFQNGAPGLHWSRVWTLYILIRWCHRHNVLA